MKLLIAVLIAFCIYAVVRRIYIKKWDENLNIEIDFPEGTVREGNNATLAFRITNAKWLPLPVVLVKFAITRTFIFKNTSQSAVTDQFYRTEYFTLKPFERIIRSYSFVCSKRGYFGMKDMDVICKDLFLSEEMYSTREHEARLIVLPARIPNKDIPDEMHKLMGDIESRNRLLDDPFAFQMIREYQPYDSMKSVNWKSSARMDKLMVNTFNSTIQREVVIILNLICNSSIGIERMQEEMIRIAATISAGLINRKIPVALISNGRDCISDMPVKVAGGADGKHISTIEYALARIDLTKKMESFSDMLVDIISKTPPNSTAGKDFIFISNERKDYVYDAIQQVDTKDVNITYVLPQFKTEAAGAIRELDGASLIRWVVDNE